MPNHAEGKDAGHSKAGQIKGQRAVPYIITGKKRAAGNQVRHHKQGFQYSQRSRRIGVNNQIIAAEKFRYAGIAHDSAYRLHQEKGGQKKAGCRSRGDLQDLRQGRQYAFRPHAPDPPAYCVIEDQEDNLSEEEIVVDHGHQGRHKDEAVQTPACSFAFTPAFPSSLDKAVKAQ